MIVSYFRSSSINNWKFCQQQYYLNYVLGIPRTAGKKADKGTCVHKVMEILANCKKVMQLITDPIDQVCIMPVMTFIYDDENIGRIEWTQKDFLDPYSLTNEEVETINKTRINKYTYLHDVKIPYGTIHYGKNFVDNIFEKVYNYYSNEDWAPVDKKDCYNWVWMVLEYKNGMFDPRKKNIFEAEFHFDFIIDKKWAEYSWKNSSGEYINGSLGIKGTIDLITKVNEDTLEIEDYKGLTLDTPLPTPKGWTTMGKVQLGDMVLDENGKPTKVVGKSKIKNKPCYKITFDDTSTVVCDDEHLWKLSDGFIYPVTKLKIKDKINITKPLKLRKNKLPIDPYVLGIWLGDGRNRSGEISGADQFIFDEIEHRGYKIGKNIGGKNRCKSHTVFNLTSKLRKLNLLHNKHIPQIYLRSSYKQRLDLLRGLMDSDGSVNIQRKQCVFTNCYKPLSEDVKELLLSLGQRPLLSHVVNKQFDNDIDVYPISFKPVDINPFLLPRKALKINDTWGYGKSTYRQIRKIEKITPQLTQCIMVDSKSHTYLCTKNMIPTHNTGKRIDWASSKDNDTKTYDKLCTDLQLMLYYYAVRKMFPEFKNVIVSIFWIRHGGPFTICMDDSILEKVELKLKEKFDEIKNCTQPKMLDVNQRHFKCTRICDYYKMVAPNGDNMCRFIHDQINKHGIDYVTNKYTMENFDVGHYQAPGEN